MIVRALTVDPDPLARQTLLNLLRGYPWIQPLSALDTASDALELIERERPELILTEIELPGMTGLELISRCSYGPTVVVVTSTERYASSAYELEVLDYLLKPVQADRFARVVHRVQKSFNHNNSSSDPPSHRLFLRQKNELVQIAPEEIARIEACGDYVHVYARGVRHLIHLSLKEVLRRMRSDTFLQIHRSHVVNLDHVKSLRPHDDRRFSVSLEDGTSIVASRAGTQLLKTLTI